MKTSSWRVSSGTPYRMTFSCRGFLFGPLRRQKGNSGVIFDRRTAGLSDFFNPGDGPGQSGNHRRSRMHGAGHRQQCLSGRTAQKPVNDADDMSRVLTALGFRVTHLKNVDRRAMEDSIRSFGRQLKHGMH